MTVLWPNGGTATPPKPGATGSGFRATSEFGRRTHPVSGAPGTFHYGLDLIGWSTIKAPVAGTVTIASYQGSYGNLVEITDSKGDRYRMAHNKSISVKKGAKVKQGQSVAIMGTTGNSTGVHSHFEVKPRGKNQVNPRSWMATKNAKPTSIGRNQRKAVLPVNGRKTPSTDSAVVGSPLTKGKAYLFIGWKYGEKVTQNGVSSNVWVQGPSKRWFWLGGLSPRSVSGIKDLNTKKSVTRKTGGAVVNARLKATTKSTVKVTLKANTNYVVTAYTKGQKVTQGGVTTDIWFRRPDGGWCWSGAFTTRSVTGLPKV